MSLGAQPSNFIVTSDIASWFPELVTARKHLNILVITHWFSERNWAMRSACRIRWKEGGGGAPSHVNTSHIQIAVFVCSCGPGGGASRWMCRHCFCLGSCKCLCGGLIAAWQVSAQADRHRLRAAPADLLCHHHQTMFIFFLTVRLTLNLFLSLLLHMCLRRLAPVKPSGPLWEVRN